METPRPNLKGVNGGAGHGGGDRREAPTAIELTRCRNADGALSKRIKLGPDDKLVSTLAANMVRSSMERMPLDDWRQFAEILEQTPSDVAYTLGRLRPDLPDRVPLAIKGKAGADPAKGAPRSRESFTYTAGAPGLALIDFDVNETPVKVRASIDAKGGFLGEHDYLLVLDAADVKRCLIRFTPAPGRMASAGICSARTARCFSGRSSIAAPPRPSGYASRRRRNFRRRWRNGDQSPKSTTARNSTARRYALN
ncbi:hypothetical protein WOC76_04040 [Methylocystis sp. IM3]|uniref:hypothetical protein n=1 Tax=unclassified Methylocystis TaxID=2625913 RepID=UPI0030FBB18B